MRVWNNGVVGLVRVVGGLRCGTGVKGGEFRHECVYGIRTTQLSVLVTTET